MAQIIAVPFEDGSWDPGILTLCTTLHYRNNSKNHPTNTRKYPSKRFHTCNTTLMRLKMNQDALRSRIEDVIKSIGSVGDQPWIAQGIGEAVVADRVIESVIDIADLHRSVTKVSGISILIVRDYNRDRC